MDITLLLNTDSDVATASLPSLKTESSLSSSTSPSPPLLSRSSSSETRESECWSTRSSSSFSSPSPLTPAYTIFEPAATKHHQHAPNQHQQRYYLHHHSYTKMDDQNASLYPPVPDATGSMPQAYAMPPMQQSQQQQPQQQTGVHAFRNSDSPVSEPSRVSNTSAQHGQKPPKKNQYPCPMAKQIGCTDFFTTSGHAARHAKKHTGKKDAFCPECNKAFTRKDNMEQHRRTHQNGRGASRSANNNDDSKVKKTTKTPAKKSVVKASEPVLEAAVEQQLADQAQAAQAQAQQAAQAAEEIHAQAILPPLPMDQQMMLPASGPYFLNTMDAGPVPALPMAMPDISGRPPLHRASFASSLDYVPPIAPTPIDPDTLHYSYPSPGLSNGLNSLALAASARGRLTEKSESHSPSETLSGDRTP